MELLKKMQSIFSPSGEEELMQKFLIKYVIKNQKKMEKKTKNNFW